jgi:hypothetical protein
MSVGTTLLLSICARSTGGAVSARGAGAREGCGGSVAPAAIGAASAETNMKIVARFISHLAVEFTCHQCNGNAARAADGDASAKLASRSVRWRPLQ